MRGGVHAIPVTGRRARPLSLSRRTIPADVCASQTDSELRNAGLMLFTLSLCH